MITNPDWNLQVKIGRGSNDTGAHHRAIEVARQLLATGRWPDYLNTLIVIHEAYELHRRLQLSGPGTYHADYHVVVYPAVYELEAGRDFEIVYNQAIIDTTATAGADLIFTKASPTLPDGRIDESPRRPLFALGHVVMTPGAAALHVDFLPYLAMHSQGQWGQLDRFDWRQNDIAVKEGYRILSAYDVLTGGSETERIWIITEADRSSTCVLKPSEY